MEYFVMRQDPRLTNMVEPQGLLNQIDKYAYKNDERQYFDKSAAFCYIKEKPCNDYGDYLEKPLPLVSDKLKMLLEEREKCNFFKTVALYDSKRMHQEVYSLLMPLKFSCLSTQTEFNKDGSVKKLVLEQSKLGCCKVFRVSGIVEELVIINLDLVEKILHQGFFGLKFEPVALEGQR